MRWAQTGPRTQPAAIARFGYGHHFVTDLSKRLVSREFSVRVKSPECDTRWTSLRWEQSMELSEITFKPHNTSTSNAACSSAGNGVNRRYVWLSNVIILRKILSDGSLHSSRCVCVWKLPIKSFHYKVQLNCIEKANK